ncbi:glycosyltransferase family 2 protein [Bacteroides ovatus]|uniref:glycosyltransferase family 2 protein n=3 Tax=Bacteroides ovatus TaxID=28116 RepID=UPI00202DC8EB|nr:glycosyltransferase family 2 protein [Bacteroides ovatus]MCM1723275.1 glycosyltransferase family 2 protein [Bacteroides ovatus]MCM1868940.1 glycosyltransferase family 2 protein [Bacteroides ovatus]
MDLTIVIPTYNRKDRLIHQLKSIFRQPLSKGIRIQILDNASDYNIEEVLKQNFTLNQVRQICLRVNPFNIGQALNLTIPFLYCETEWMWLLSDDDETADDALEVILRDMHEHSGASMIKYSIIDSVPQEDVIITNINDFIGYYRSGKHTSGDLIFMSNNLFNLKRLFNHLGSACEYSYTYISYLIPVLKVLAEEDGYMKFSSSAIVRFIPPESNNGWVVSKRYINVSLGIATIEDIYLGKISYRLQQELIYILTRDFSHGDIIKILFTEEDKKRRKHIYLKLFRTIFHKGSRRWFYFCVFFFYYYLGINLFLLKR